jgi:hypothetical protein
MVCHGGVSGLPESFLSQVAQTDRRLFKTSDGT